MPAQSFPLSLGALLLGVAVGFIAVFFLLPRPHSPSGNVRTGLSSQTAFSGSTLSDSGGASPRASPDGVPVTPDVADMNVNNLLAEKNPFKRAADEYAFVESLDQDAAAMALGQVSGSPQGVRQLELEKLLLAKMAKSDPKRALTLAAGLSNVHAAMELAAPLLKDWIDKDQTEAWAWGESLPDGLEKNRLLSAALAYESEANPAGAASYILQIMSQPGSDLIYGKAAAEVARSLAGSDPAAMQKFVAQLPEGYAKTEAVSAAARVMAKSDPKGAAELLMSSRLNANITNELTSVMNNWGKKDLPAALAFADGLPAGAQKDPMRFLLPQLAQTDPNAALDEVAKINNPEVTYALMQSLPAALKVETSDQAIVIAAQLPDGDVKALFLSNCAFKLIQTNPQAGATLIAQLPDGPAKNAAVDNLVDRLSWKDLPTAQNYMASLPSGALRDRAIQVLISDQSAGHPDLGVQWAVQYADTQKRAQALTYQYGKWVKLDPNAAQAWLNQAPLDATTKQQLQITK